MLRVEFIQSLSPEHELVRVWENFGDGYEMNCGMLTLKKGGGEYLALMFELVRRLTGDVGTDRSRDSVLDNGSNGGYVAE